MSWHSIESHPFVFFDERTINYAFACQAINKGKPEIEPIKEEFQIYFAEIVLPIDLVQDWNAMMIVISSKNVIISL